VARPGDEGDCAHLIRRRRAHLPSGWAAVLGGGVSAGGTGTVGWTAFAPAAGVFELAGGRPGRGAPGKETAVGVEEGAGFGIAAGVGANAGV
jgi:hypothetical protein